MLDRTRRLLQKLPIWVEAFVVLFLAFGATAISTANQAFEDVEFSNEIAIGLIVQELAIGGICVLILYLRGWKLWDKFPFDVNLKNVGLATGLVVLSYGALIIFYNLAIDAVGLDALRISKFTVTANLPLILAVSLLNPLFEETFVTYYVFERLKNYGPFIFIAASSVLRVSYHLYQGWFSVISILPLGILFAIAFWKTKNLMPLYLAHVLEDIIGLVANSQP